MPVSRLQLNPDGPAFSRIIFGYWRLNDWGHSPDERLAMMHALLDAGLTTFDHADIYGVYTCEDLFGEALALEPSLRENMELVTKCGIKLPLPNDPRHRIAHYNTSRNHIIRSVEASLSRLRTDRIDVLLIHRPDPLMNADEVAETFIKLKDDGKVLHFGVSNFTPFQFDLLASRLPFPLVTNQVECSVLNFDVMHDGTLDQCQQLKVAPMAWSPFAGGRLFTGEDEQAVRVRAVLGEIGHEHGGASIDQIALAWLLQHPSQLMPILGSGKLDRIVSALRAESINLSRQQWFSVWRASKGHDVP